MIVKFFCYNKINGNIILLLPDSPDNVNFDDVRGDIIHKGKTRAGGINWDNVDWESSSTGFELDETHKWSYDSNTGDFIDLGVDDD